MSFEDNNLEGGDPTSGSQSPLSSQQNERLLDLMIQLATTGISESEQQELDGLVALSGQAKSSKGEFLHEQEAFELSAAALDLSMLGKQEEMPDSVRDRVLFDAGQHFKSAAAAKAKEASSQGDQDSVNSKVELSSRVANGITRREAVAMAVTAASLVLLLSGWNPFAKYGTSQNNGPSNTQPIALSAAQKMAQFVEAKPTDLVRETWTQVDENYVGTEGEVLWSDDAQEGYMVLTGIAPNDPLVEQFQLWIFDTDPAQAHPVDGGVFDIAASEFDSAGKMVIPIRAHIPVKQAVMFAVTVERPGGVTVSKRERIPVLAKIASVN